MKSFKDLKEEIAKIAKIDMKGFASDCLLRKFARNQALINIELIKPYTDKYDLIVRFLVTGKDANNAADAAASAASASDDASDDSATYAASAATYAASSAANATDAATDAADVTYAATDISTDYTKAIKSLNTLASEYLAR